MDRTKLQPKYVFLLLTAFLGCLDHYTLYLDSIILSFADVFVFCKNLNFESYILDHFNVVILQYCTTDAACNELFTVSLLLCQLFQQDDMRNKHFSAIFLRVYMLY